MSGDREEAVTSAFVALADTLVDDYDVVDLLLQLVGHAASLLAVDSAGLVLADHDGGLRMVASSGPESRLERLWQVQSEEGPCVECHRLGTPVLVPDLSVESGRWPRFAAEAARVDVRSVHAVPLRLRREVIGSMCLFGSAPGALGTRDMTLGQALADVATIGILHERALHRSEVRGEQLQSALNSRIVIEQAKGVLAERGDLDMDTAFARLRAYARNDNLKLADVARDLVAGALRPDDLLAERRHVRGAARG